MCEARGKQDETAEHLFLYCKGLHPAAAVGSTGLEWPLGFEVSAEKREEGKVEITTQRLVDWFEVHVQGRGNTSIVLTSYFVV